MSVSRCANCSLLLKRPLPQHQVGDVTAVMLSILKSWINPAIVSEDSCVCQECFLILQNAEINYSTGDFVERTYGHQQVCLGCGKSILRAKTHNIPSGSPERDVIIACIPIQQVHRLEKVCLSCWTSAYKSVRRHAQVDQNRQQVPMQKRDNISHVDADVITSSARSSMESPVLKPPLLPNSQPHIGVPSNNPKITSHIYKRAPASSRHCIFAECHQTERLLVPSVIKQMLLLEHKLYIPTSARICLYHLNLGLWNELNFSFHNFTGRQMDNMMTIMDRASRRQNKSRGLD